MPRRRLMWKNASDTRYKLVANPMKWEKFEAILTNFHFADNNFLDGAEKFSKVRTHHLKHLNKKFLEEAPVEEFYSFDKSMCEYYRRHGCKQILGANQYALVSRFGVMLLLQIIWLGLIHTKREKPYHQWKKGVVSALEKTLFIRLRMFFRVTYKSSYIYVLTTFHQREASVSPKK